MDWIKALDQFLHVNFLTFYTISQAMAMNGFI